ncbi:MAG: carboxylesterase/lipase family protein, partial [Dehalococcoidia bacterium]
MAPVVRTPYGQVAGEQRDGVTVFRGIPYARAPLGELRFRAPQPPEPWSDVRDATRFGPIAMQNPSPMDTIFGAVQRPAMSEDCLSLNVWTPGLDDGRRPVMVWIHGGAFVGGSGSTPWYDGTAFASRGDVVVVTLNYRLGALGFLHLADLGGDAFAGSGNVGILDQVAALRWVRESIAAFGGDPENVTVFGQSAGARSIATMMSMPNPRGLFDKAILQSGPALALPATHANRVMESILEHLALE